jgi:hypothetical protein
MKLSVPSLKQVSKETPVGNISAALDTLESHAIQKMPWSEFSYKPQVAFSIAYTEDCILLKYFVKEKAIRIQYHTDNSPVHEDSCVEFFIAFGNDEEYYNLEFNCGGTCMLGFGKNISQRKLIEKEVIRKIRRQSVIQSLVDGENNTVNWELTLVIPLEIFVHHQVNHLKDQHCTANFYKCGDKLPEPHFLAWNNIKAASPNFHLPEFFGRMHFV